MNFAQQAQPPNKIAPCPIAEAIVELRFDSDLPRDTIVGIIYNRLQKRYPNFKPLPITQLPTDLINQQANLKYAPHYCLTNNDFIFQIGPRSFSIVCPKEYKGWSCFFNEIKWIFKEMWDANIIKTPERIGIRYVNFFLELNIFEKIKTHLFFGEDSLANYKNTLRTEFDIENFYCVYQITNNSLFQENDKSYTGSSIDIDLIYRNPLDLELKNYENIINSGHKLEKKLFFGILNDDFLNSLAPEY